MTEELGKTSSDYLKLREDIKQYFLKYGHNDPEKKLPSKVHKEVAEENTKNVYDRAKLIEPTISEDLKNILEPGISEFKSFDHRIKEYDSLKRKIIADSKKYEGSYFRAASRIFDSIRYTIVIPDDIYVEKVDSYLKEIEDLGYYVVDFKNNWGSDACQGYNVRLHSKTARDIFEIQFHTPFGYQIKEGFTRDLYEIARDERTDDEIMNLKIQANKFRKLFFKLVPIPIGAKEYRFNRVLTEEVNGKLR